MTRKDFELTAQVVAGSALGREERRHIANSFADRFEQINPRFDRAKFLKACGIN